MSGRFGVMPQEFYVPAARDVQGQAKTNKQGRAGKLSTKIVDDFVDGVVESANAAFETYEGFLMAGVARELARDVLPLNVYTKKVWTIDLHNLLHFLKLRTAPEAMLEIQRYAEVIEMIVDEAWPLTHASWRNHVKDAVTFSADELKVLWEAIEARSAGAPLEDPFGCPPLTGSRLREFAVKMERVGLAPMLLPACPDEEQTKKAEARLKKTLDRCERKA